MTAVATDDAWLERALVTIQAIGGTARFFDALTETIDIDQGDKSIDIIALINGGRIVKYNPQEPTTITLEAYPLAVGTVSGTTGLGFHDLFHSGSATADPYVVVNDFTRTKFRVALMWTNDPTALSGHDASASTAATYSAIRLAFAEARLTSEKISFTDGIMKWTLKFTVAPFDKSAVSNFNFQSAPAPSGSGTLSALASYTTSAKF